ncbi:MAG: serine/threonine-protein kinase [Phycisphaerales bacterium]
MTDSAERHRRACELFAELAPADRATRAARLADIAMTDASLSERVAAMLAADAGEFGTVGDMRRAIDAAIPPSLAAEDPADVDPLAGSTIGGFRIERLIAKGGMGRVYEASQDSPQRRVAVKLLDVRMASPAALARFRNEADVMARLLHPGIAQIYEWGAQRDVPGTVPWFAMELVPNAATITEAARERRLDRRERIDLFLRVCDAVQFGHGRGVIHRDIKPSNVLVDRSSPTLAPKVIDFGIARSTDSDMTRVAQRTEVGELVGTLQYMSPEQLAGDPRSIDVRCDVYALGLLLHELLTDRVARDVSGLSVWDALRMLSTSTPPRLRDVDPSFKSSAAIDLETIVAKAIERDVDRRYSSVLELAQDLRRYLAHEPISARAPSAVYSVRLFARRHGAVVWGAAATFTALVAGVVGTSFGLLQAQRGESAAAQALGVADAARRDAEFDAYVANVTAAEAALRTHDVRLARERLAAAPAAHRGWEWRHLVARLDRSEARAQHDGVIHARMAYTVDGESIVFVDDGGRVRLLDARSLAERWRMTGPPRWPCALALSSDGRRAAVGHDKVGVAVIDITTRSVVATCNIPTVACVAFIGSGDTILVAGRDGSIARWDPATPAPVSACADPGVRDRLKGCSAIAVSRDGSYVLMASDAGAWIVDVDACAAQQCCSFARDDRPHHQCVGAFSGDGQSVALVIDGARLVVRSRVEDDERSTFLDEVGIGSLAWSPGDDAIILGGAGGELSLRDARTLRPARTFVGHEFPISTIASTSSGPDGPRVVSVDWTGVVRAWRSDTSDVIRHQASKAWIYDVAFAPDNSWFAVATGEAPAGEPLTASFETRSGRRRWASEPGATPTLNYSLCVSGDGRHVIHGGYAANAVDVRDAETGTVARALEVDSPGGIRKVRLRPKHDELFEVEPNHPVHQHSLIDGRLVRTYPLEHVNEIAVSADGETLALSPRPASGIVVYALADGSELARLATKACVSSMTFSFDGRRFAARCDDGKIVVWRTATWGEERSWDAEGPWGYQIQFEPGGGRLVGRVYRGLRVWDVDRGRELVTLAVPADPSHGFSFSPDGTWVGIGCTDGSVVLFDAPPLQQATAQTQ